MDPRVRVSDCLHFTHSRWLFVSAGKTGTTTLKGAQNCNVSCSRNLKEAAISKGNRKGVV